LENGIINLEAAKTRGFFDPLPETSHRGLTASLGPPPSRRQQPPENRRFYQSNSM